MATFKEFRSAPRVAAVDAAHAAQLAKSRAERQSTIDDSCFTQKAVGERIALGLALLELARAPGQTFTYYDIAAWAGCTNAMVYMIERRALVKLANALQFGRHKAVFAELFGALAGERPLTTEEIRATAKKFTAIPSRDEVRAALARCRKGKAA